MLVKTLTKRAAVTAAVSAILLTACGGGADQSGADPASPSPASTSSSPTSAASTPLHAPQAPAPPAAPGATAVGEPTVAETVKVRTPDVLVRPKESDPGATHVASGVDGVEHLTGATRFRAKFVVTPPVDNHGDTSPPPTPAPPEKVAVSVLGIDPFAFRPLTPEVTAQEPGVWQRLLEGDIVVRHDVAQKLGLELGETYPLVGPAGEIEARVGAFASNGAPPLAEVLVPWALATQLGAGDTNLLIISTEKDADVEDVGAAVVEAIDGGKITVRNAPEEQRAQLVGTGQFSFEPFAYTDLGDGMIVIDSNWVSEWITTVTLPGLGSTRCHRVMVPQLMKALEEIDAMGLYGHFKAEQFGGCYMPRHIDWDPTKPLSMHAWGLAIDFNTHDNWLGHTPTMDPRIVEVFERWGFEWGGRWSRPDGMHFQLDRVIEVGD